MFPLPYPQPLKGILYALFGLELALLAGGLAFGKRREDRTGRLPRALRMALSVLLVVAALLGWRAGAVATPIECFAQLIFWGMAAGSVGDWMMAELIPVPNRLVGGMLAFGIGHLFYVAALLSLSIRSGYSDTSAYLTTLATCLSVCAWAWYTYIHNPGRSRIINVGSLAYGLLIGAVCALATTLALHDARYAPLAAGAFLFLTSDLILGSWVIRGHAWDSVNDVIWITYVLGQLLIVYSVAAALNV